MKLKVELKLLWSFTVEERFNVLRAGNLFRQPGLSLILGGEDGIIRIYNIIRHGRKFEKPDTILETKSGPVQMMAVHDVTKFYDNDLCVCDSRGMLTIFCNQQILSRKVVSDHSLNCLQVQQDADGTIAIVMSDDCGVITAMSSSLELWKLNLNDLSQHKEPAMAVVVTCLLSVDIPGTHGHVISYILAADGAKRLHVLHHGNVVMTIQSPAIITAMTHGRFISLTDVATGKPLQSAGGLPAIKDTCQVALGTDTGSVFILHNFSISLDEYANAGLPISHLATLSRPDPEQDVLLCAGDFNALHVYKQAKKIGHYETPDWINSIDTSDVDDDGMPEILLGCLDNSVHAIKLYL